MNFLSMIKKNSNGNKLINHLYDINNKISNYCFNMYQIYFIYMYNTLKKFKDYNFYIEIKKLFYLIIQKLFNSIAFPFRNQEF